jgi:hypothetical protein
LSSLPAILAKEREVLVDLRALTRGRRRVSMMILVGCAGSRQALVTALAAADLS